MFAYASKDAFNSCLTLYGSDKESTGRGIIIFKQNEADLRIEEGVRGSNEPTTGISDHPRRRLPVLKYESVEQIYSHFNGHNVDNYSVKREPYVDPEILVSPSNNAKIIITDDYEYFMSLAKAVKKTALDESKTNENENLCNELDFSSLLVWPSLPIPQVLSDIERFIQTASDNGSVIAVSDSWSLCDAAESWEIISSEGSPEGIERKSETVGANGSSVIAKDVSNSVTYLDILKRGNMFPIKPITTTAPIKSTWSPKFIFCTRKDLISKRNKENRLLAEQTESLESTDDYDDDIYFDYRQGVKSPGSQAIASRKSANIRYQNYVISSRNRSSKIFRSVK